METVNHFNLHSFVVENKEIEEIYSNWKKAVMTNDLQFLESLYSDDFTSTSPAGIIRNRAEVLTRLRFKDVQYLFWEDQNILIHIKEDDAILKSSQTLNIELYGLPIKIGREIMLTFKTRNGKWILKNISETSLNKTKN